MKIPSANCVVKYVARLTDKKLVGKVACAVRAQRAHVRPVRVVGARGAAVGVSAGVQGVGVGVAEPGCWEYHGGSYTDTGSGRPFCLGAGAERRPWFTRWPVTWPCYTFREI